MQTCPCLSSARNPSTAPDASQNQGQTLLSKAHRPFLVWSLIHLLSLSPHPQHTYTHTHTHTDTQAYTHMNRHAYTHASTHAHAPLISHPELSPLPRRAISATLLLAFVHFPFIQDVLSLLRHLVSPTPPLKLSMGIASSGIPARKPPSLLHGSSTH